MNITYTNTLTPDEYNTLRTAVGWVPIERSLAAKGLENTAFLVCARDGAQAVGMARIITDYGYIVYVADVIVIPEYQGKGLGREIMSRIMGYINESTAPGQTKFISLMSAKGKEAFYEKFGFVKRPTNEFGYGMTIRLEK